MHGVETFKNRLSEAIQLVSKTCVLLIRFCFNRLGLRLPNNENFSRNNRIFSVKIHGVETFKNRLSEAIVTGIHNMCFSD